MDVGKIEFLDGEWIEIEVQSEKITAPFRFKVQPVLESAARVAKTSTDMVVGAVVDWAFSDGDAPLPCDEANKRKYLTRFVGYMVKSVNGKPAVKSTSLGSAIIDFAANPDNFLKN